MDFALSPEQAGVQARAVFPEYLPDGLAVGCILRIQLQGGRVVVQRPGEITASMVGIAVIRPDAGVPHVVLDGLLQNRKTPLIIPRFHLHPGPQAGGAGGDGLAPRHLLELPEGRLVIPVVDQRLDIVFPDE